jgi:hypothetical protein
MEGIKYLNVRDARSQGIVGDDVGIRTFTVLCLAAGYPRIVRAGSLHVLISSYRSGS